MGDSASDMKTMAEGLQRRKQTIIDDLVSQGLATPAGREVLSRVEEKVENSEHPDLEVNGGSETPESLDQLFFILRSNWYEQHKQPCVIDS